jgi:hypothetical protein
MGQAQQPWSINTTPNRVRVRVSHSNLVQEPISLSSPPSLTHSCRFLGPLPSRSPLTIPRPGRRPFRPWPRPFTAPPGLGLQPNPFSSPADAPQHGELLRRPYFRATCSRSNRAPSHLTSGPRLVAPSLLDASRPQTVNLYSLILACAGARHD